MIPPSNVIKSSEQKREARLKWKKFGEEALQVLCGGWSRLWPRLWIIFAACGIGMLLVLLFGKFDNSVAAKFWLEKGRVKSVSQFVSDYADIVLAIPLSIWLWCVGVSFRRVRWRKVGLACLLATLIAGLIVTVFRGSTGRPRPEAQLPDGFYGPPKSFRSKYQSFPSGHATTSTATAIVIGVTVPVTAIPCAAYAIAVNISRMQLRKHHPIDVVIGSIIGATCGLCFASTVPRTKIRLRRRRKKARRSKTAATMRDFGNAES